MITITFIYFTPNFRRADGTYSVLFYSLFALVTTVTSLINITKLRALWAFIASVIDLNIGGTYFSLLGTLGAIGKRHYIILLYF